MSGPWITIPWRASIGHQFRRDGDTTSAVSASAISAVCYTSQAYAIIEVGWGVYPRSVSRAAPAVSQPPGQTEQDPEEVRVATPTQQDDDRVTLQSVVPRALADELKRYAEANRRSVSNAIRIAVEDRLANGRRP